MANETFKKYIHPIHKEGYIFIAIFAVIALIMWAMADFLGLIGLFLTLWCVYFFRDPKREVPNNENLVVSPADGLVVFIKKAAPPAELELEDNSERTKVSIFLSVVDVHVNRTPIEGKIEKVEYFPGQFLSAELDKASEKNERNSLVIRGKDDKQYVVVQIAGLIARRIKCCVKEGDDLNKGERIGIIRFGSRVDLYLPQGVEPQVGVGQRTIGGETIIADLNRPEGIEVTTTEV